MARALLIASLLFLAMPGRAADSRQAANLDQVGAWLPRLIGKFRLEGTVELAAEAGSGRRESIRGQADCRNVPGASAVLGRAPAVECVLDMLRAPLPDADGAAGQNPAPAPAPHRAVLLYGYELHVIGLRYMLVDGNGVAEGGAAQLFDNMLVSTSRCARIAGSCQRSVRITAGPDLGTVKLIMATEVDGRRASGHDLTLHREPATP